MMRSAFRSAIRCGYAFGARQHCAASRAASFIAAGRVSSTGGGAAVGAVQCRRRMLSNVADTNEVETSDGYAPTDPVRCACPGELRASPLIMISNRFASRMCGDD